MKIEVLCFGQEQRYTTTTHRITLITQTLTYKIMSAMAAPFTIVLSSRRGRSSRVDAPPQRRPSSLSRDLFAHLPIISGSKATTQVRRKKDTTSGRFGFHNLRSAVANKPIPIPVTNDSAIAKKWEIDWSKPMQRTTNHRRCKPVGNVSAAKVLHCNYCKGDGHRIFEWVNGFKKTTCPLLIAKETQQAAKVASKKITKKPIISEDGWVSAGDRAKEALANRIKAQLAKQAEPEVVEDDNSDSDSDSDSHEEFPALPSTTRRVTIVEENNEVRHFVKGSAPADLKKDLAESKIHARAATAQERHDRWSKFPDTLTTHERQKIHDELREKRAELAELQQANSGSWADAGDEEDIEEEIAELEASLLLASGYTLRA